MKRGESAPWRRREGAGWINTQLSKARLAVVPGYSHYNFITSTELGPIIDKYLADPLTNPAAGAAASQSTK